MRASADTPVAVDPSGPFVPLAEAVEKDARLRDVLARALPIPSLRGYAKVRVVVLALAALPLALLALVDARAALGDPGGPYRFFVVDLLLAAYLGFELARPTPRMPAALALALSAVALRWTLFVTRLCDRPLPLYVYLAPAAAAAATLVVLARVPSRERVALELLDRVGVSRSEARAATALPPPPGARVVAAIVAAVALPALLFALRSGSMSLAAQGAVFVGYALVVPFAADRIGGRSPVSIPPARIAWGVLAGIVVTAALMTAARSFVDTGTELARCLDKLDVEARRLAEREATELSTAIVKVRGSSLLFALTAIVLPFAEERVYRGLLMDTLVRKYGRAYGLFASAVVFGIAHVPVYQIGLYQTVLLGIAFGLSYLEGGLVAAVVVHATWNLLLLS